MSPTVEELATITITRETQEKWAVLVKAVADAMQVIVDAFVEGFKRFTEFLDALELTPQPSYPGVAARFERRGHGRPSSTARRLQRDRG